MLDLEAKISSFRKMVWDEEKERSESELYKSTEDNSNIVDDKKKNLQRDLDNNIKNREAFANTRKNEEVSKKIYDSKNDLYIYRQSLLDDLEKKIKRRLVEFTKSDEYKNELNDNINKQLKELNLDKDNVYISVRNQDLDLIDFPNTESLDDKYIGGFIITNKDRDFRYNFTFLNRIKDKKYEVGKQLNQLLESEYFDESKN